MIFFKQISGSDGQHHLHLRPPSRPQGEGPGRRCRRVESGGLVPAVARGPRRLPGLLLPLPRRMGGRALPAPHQRRPPRRRPSHRGGPRHGGAVLSRLPRVGPSVRGGAHARRADCNAPSAGASRQRMDVAIVDLLRQVQHHSPRESAERLRQLLVDDPVAPPCLAIPWALAACRPLRIGGIADMPYQHTRSLRMVLLDTIHGFYLQALARLPSGELRSRLHRSLLRAGYCYGPMDPASNIILNTIWYEANFPAEITPVLDVIGPKSLTRLVSRSFYGLVSFLQTRYHNLSEHQAVQCLVSTCGQLRAADPNFCAPGDEKAQQHIWCSDSPIILCGPLTKAEQQTPSAGIQEAYEAAATAAWHPNPEQQATFLTSWEGDHYSMGTISLEEVRYLCSVLSPNQPPIPERICSSSYPVRAGKMRSQAQQRRISRMVEAALNKHLLRDGVGLVTLLSIIFP